MIGTTISAAARYTLNDPSGLTWVDAELVGWINDACLWLAGLRPDSVAVNATVTLVAGSKQGIAGLTPAGFQLLDAVKNSAGRSMRLVDRDVLDSYVPSWHAAAQGVPTDYVYDTRDPLNYYVYPPATAGAQIDIIYARVPATITALGDTLTPDNTWQPAIVNYVLHRAYSKEAPGGDVGLAASYFAAAEGYVAGRTQGGRSASPDLNAPGGKPSAGAASGGV